MKKRLTIVCPVYNEEAALPLFFARIRRVIEHLDERYEADVLFINNSSTDRTLEVIDQLRAEYRIIYTITLSSNVGYQCAVECGLRSAKGDVFVVIDVDCEDPPEMIADFLERYERGYDIVYGERVDRTEGAVMKGLRRMFYRVTRAIADEEIVLDMAEFALISAEVRDAIIADASSFPFIRASIGRIGFKRVGIPYKRQARVAGQTHYNLLRMTTFAVAGILSSSTLLLRLPVYLLPFWLIAVIALAASYLASGSRWVMVLLIGLICLYLGGTVSFIAVYVARIYKNTLGRPNYIIDRKSSSPQP